MRVLYPNAGSDSVIERLKSASGIVEISRLPEEVPDYEVLIEGRPGEHLLEGSSRLRHVIAPFAGMPQATLDILLSHRNVQLHNLHHNAVDTAELALALLLACARNVLPLDRQLRRNDWSLRYAASTSIILAGKTALVLGYGHIGKHIARGCKGLGMRVVATRRNSGRIEKDDFAEVHPGASLPSLLPEAHALMIALPQTNETVGLIGEEELSSLPKGAILVNVARGVIVDEAALYEALLRGHLHSAGLDVWYNYPSATNDVAGYFSMPEDAFDAPPSRFPFHELDNVVMSPHRGGVSVDSEERRVAALAKMLKAISAGETVPNRVELHAGY